jgi:hypothetical protein
VVREWETQASLVGRDSNTAHQRQVRKQAELREVSQGLVVTDVEEEASKNHVKVAVHDFLEEVKLAKRDKKWRGYKIALRYVQESCDKTHLEDIQRIDLLRFSAFLRERKKVAPRTVPVHVSVSIGFDWLTGLQSVCS